MFSSQLLKYRKLKGLTQSKLADELSVLLNKKFQKGNVQSWERGSNPRVEIIQAIAKVLDIPVQFLFDDSEEVVLKIIEDKYPFFIQQKILSEQFQSIIKSTKANMEHLEQIIKASSDVLYK